MALLLPLLAFAPTADAAFVGTTGNAGNTWTSGTVGITDDDSGTAMFTATNLRPLDTGSTCIRLTYGGSIAATVRLYAPSVTGAFAGYVNVVIEEGAAGAFAGCGSFTPTSTLYSGTLASLGSAHGNYGSSLAVYSPSGAGQARTCRITYTVRATTPDAQQGGSASASFTWEARSS